jgi:hypothetical protein
MSVLKSVCKNFFGNIRIFHKQFLLGESKSLFTWGCITSVWGPLDGNHRKIRLIESHEKCRHLKKLPAKGLCCRCLSVWGSAPLLGFCLGWSSNFVGFDSGQIQSAKLLKNMASGLNTPIPPSHTHCQYILYFDTGKGGGGDEPERRL